MVYLDNILIYLAIAKDHTRHVRAVCEWLAKSKFYLECKKGALVLPKVELFGHVVSECKVSLSLGKVYAVLEWPVLSLVYKIHKLFRFM